MSWRANPRAAEAMRHALRERGLQCTALIHRRRPSPLARRVSEARAVDVAAGRDPPSSG